jgi:hypothetical protein
VKSHGQATILFALVTLVGCDRPRLNIGAECAINTDCSDPFICGFARCRRQCEESRDCGAGLRCLPVGPAVGGSCQLPEERTCALDSDCTSPLVCRFGTCTTACVEDRDCVVGAICEETAAGFGCSDPTDDLCVYDSDCPEPLVCASGQRCQLECVEDRDCAPPRICLADLCQLPDGG